MEQGSSLGRVQNLLNHRKQVAQLSNEKNNDGAPFKYIGVDDIVSNPDQPRKTFDENDLKELAASIKSRGILMPIRVVKIEENKYMLVAGERRWRAAKIAGLTVVPGFISEDVIKIDQLINGLVENVQRKGLSAYEKYKTIIEIQELNPNLTDKELAVKIGISRVTLYRYLNIHKLPEHIQEKFCSLKLNDRHAKALLMLDNHKQLQDELWNKILDEKTSGPVSLNMAEEWLNDIDSNIQKSPLTNYYNDFKDKLGKIDKKIDKMEVPIRNKIVEEIKKMKSLLDDLEKRMIMDRAE